MIKFKKGSSTMDGANQTTSAVTVNTPADQPRSRKKRDLKRPDTKFHGKNTESTSVAKEIPVTPNPVTQNTAPKGSLREVKAESETRARKQLPPVPSAPPPPIVKQGTQPPKPKSGTSGVNLNDALLDRFKGGTGLAKGKNTTEAIEAEISRKKAEAIRNEYLLTTKNNPNNQQSKTTGSKPDGTGHIASGKPLNTVTQWMEANDINDMTVDDFLSATYWGCTESYLRNELKTIALSGKTSISDELFEFAKKQYQNNLGRAPGWMTFNNFKQEKVKGFKIDDVADAFIAQKVENVRVKLAEKKQPSKEMLCNQLRNDYGIKESASEYIIKNDLLIDRAFEELEIPESDRLQIDVSNPQKYFDIMKGALTKGNLEKMKDETAMERIVEILRKRGEDNLATQVQNALKS
ncbi:hypothetical protein [Endozoicomonas sp. SCSIO W0465]|uniref:hypothetical protein n=1 Tax=Endozoicomonas sp. SCSIO W0465 TaxID=2918516 RepID=UPI002075E86B|nr:hypothetical protein [Endozoicomonas sp. SCSIO W0465]USE36641.1 hypothetical protein MJO57_32335 [Endozoicomonas sp. SCSIO W0465]